MKRKIIQLAGKTHVVSLPSKWIKQFNIKKGQEIDLQELGSDILIKSNSEETIQRKINLDIDSLNERSLRYAVSALHKLGYDEITLLYEKPKLIEAIQDLTKNLLLGFVVIEQTSKKLVLKSVSNGLESEFDSTLRRAFLVTLSLANSSLDMVNLKQFSNLPSLVNLENSNNQLTSFCLRLINKGFYKDQNKKIFITTIIWNLEKIGDEYKNICLKLSKNNGDINREIIEAYNKVNKFFDSYYKIFYKFSPEKLNELVDSKEDLLEELNSIEPKNKHERILSNILSTIVSKTSDLSSSIYAMHHKD